MIDCVVIGGGCIGLSVARSIAKRYPSLSIAVLESSPCFFSQTSSRSSSVLHAGLYYPANSKRLKFCLRGHALLRELDGGKGRLINSCGKFIVAQNYEEADYLQLMKKRCDALDASIKLEFLSLKEAQSMEPNLKAKVVLHSPNTGVINVQLLEQILLADLEILNVSTLVNHRVTGISAESPKNGYRISFSANNNLKESITAKFVVNCAGLYADQVARSLDPRLSPPIQWIIGRYFRLKGNSRPFGRLIYPVPPKGSLGIHSVIAFEGGDCYFGPDASISIDNPSLLYKLGQDPHPMLWNMAAERDTTQFEREINRYLNLKDPSDSLEDLLQFDYFGIRPRLPSGDKALPGDFVVREESQFGYPGFVNCLGIESPGLTSCLAIGEYVSSLLR